MYRESYKRASASSALVALDAYFTQEMTFYKLLGFCKTGAETFVATFFSSPWPRKAAEEEKKRPRKE